MSKLSYAELDKAAIERGYFRLPETHGHRPQHVGDGWLVKCTCGFKGEIRTSRELARIDFYTHCRNVDRLNPKENSDDATL